MRRCVAGANSIGEAARATILCTDCRGYGGQFRAQEADILAHGNPKFQHEGPNLVIVKADQTLTPQSSHARI
jgi:hypothetical protein